MSDIRIEEGDIGIHAGRIFVRQWHCQARASELPVVLLHDSLGSVDQWRDFPAALARRLQRTVVAYDRLGYGRSSARHERPSVRFIA